jgi:hypothetical protein
MIGNEADLDACGSIGAVSGLKGGARSFLAVRGGPALRFKKLAELRLGDRVWVCESRNGWLGIVFGPEGKDCGVSSPVSGRRAYNGSCSSGWVSERYIRIEAG